MLQRSARESGRQVECPYRVAGKASALGTGSDVPKSAYLGWNCRYNVDRDVVLNDPPARVHGSEHDQQGLHHVHGVCGVVVAVRILVLGTMLVELS
jgi:hypothetical protein